MRFNSIANNFRNNVRSGAIHSSGVADAAAQQTGTPVRRVATSFEARQNIEHNRQLIRGFRDAKVAYGYRHEAIPHLRRSSSHALPYDDSKQPQFGANRISTGAAPAGSTRQSFNANGQSTPTGTPLPRAQAVGSSKVTFQEPKSRGYIPYH